LHTDIDEPRIKTAHDVGFFVVVGDIVDVEEPGFGRLGTEQADVVSLVWTTMKRQDGVLVTGRTCVALGSCATGWAGWTSIALGS
jgi:hypothetical protein